MVWSRTQLRLALWTLTLVRVVLIPLFVYLGAWARASARSGGDVLGLRLGVLAVLLAMGLSDVADGRLARRHGLETQLGAVVDAVADKVLQIALAIFFVFGDGIVFAQIPVWFLVLLVGRDLVLGGGWAVLRARGVPIRVVHRPHGRIGSLLVFFTFCGLAAGMSGSWVLPVLVPTSLVIVASTVAYAREGLAQRHRASSAG